MQALLGRKCFKNLGSTNLTRHMSSSALGLLYEQASLRFLSNSPLALRLVHVGQSSDKGVDLRGWWSLPQQSGSARLPVVVQCKAERSKVGARVVRELEGVIGVEGDQKRAKRPTIGVLVALSGFSPEAMARAHSSDYPIALLHLGTVDGEAVKKTSEFECRSFYPNGRVTEALGGGLETLVKREKEGGKLEVELRYLGLGAA
ncbi:hypothetical protein T439DRAFT_198761 [Meredithblackwellia eburnea MCA 4105]